MQDMTEEITHETIQIPPYDEHNQRLINNVHPSDWENPIPDGPYNLLVIGGGSAGMVASIGGAGLGAKVALVERHLLGGDCLNVGCVPSKAVIRPSKALGEIHHMAPSLGIHIPDGVEVDFGQVMERMRRIRAEISEHDSTKKLTDAGVDLYLGDGQFTGPNTFEVSGRTIKFKKALISTGSSPLPLPIPGLAEAGFLTNERIFELTERPNRLAIIGSGPIGSEMAHAFRRFGTEVTMLEIGSRIMGREDEDAANVIMDVFRREGIQLELNAKTSQVSVGPGGKIISYEIDGEQKELEVDDILVAAGRTPNISSLNLEAAGVEYHKRGVTVTDTLQTTNDDIYAAGDIAFKYQFTHTADATARIVLRNAFFPGPKGKVSDLVVPWCTYTDPEVAHVGMYEHDAEAAGIDVETIFQSIGDIDRGRTDGETEGFVKVHIQKGSDKILGATIVAAHAGEMINELTLAMVAGVGLKTIANVIHPYPTQGEAIRAVANAYNRSRLTPFAKNMLTRLMAWKRR